MPKIKSAIKRVEVAERNRLRNKQWKSAVRTRRNEVESAVKSGSAGDSAEALKAAYSIIDKAVAKGILHRNTAARRKARLAVEVQKVGKVAPKVAKAPKAKTTKPAAKKAK